jgi:hypothetical protein
MSPGIAGERRRSGVEALGSQTPPGWRERFRTSVVFREQVGSFVPVTRGMGSDARKAWEATPASGPTSGI